MLIGDALITIEEGDTVTSHVSGPRRLRGGSENTAFAGISSPEVLLFLIFPLKRVSVDIGGSVQKPGTERYPQLPRKVPVVREHQTENGMKGKRCPSHPRWALCCVSRACGACADVFL